MFNKAFTLLELVVTMTIIGLLVASFTVGKYLTQGSELRNLMRQTEKTIGAINNFADRYGQYPGDFNDAYDYWPNACETEEACEGNGNGKIDSNSESLLAWLHLSNSSLITGNYNGQGNGDNVTQTGGINVPKGNFGLIQLGLIYYEAEQFPDSFHYLILGGEKSEDIGYGAAIAPNDAYLIDEKMDDTFPGSGTVIGRNGYKDGDYENSNCLVDNLDGHVANNATDILDAFYNGNVNGLECMLAIKF